MFGYVVVNQPELKFREFDRYRAYYCGLCRCLKTRYGLLGRFSLNYDMTFLSMVLNSLYEPETTICERRCAAHAFVKQRELSSTINQYVADMNVLMAYHKCMDDWKDEKRFFRMVYGRVLEKKLKKNQVLDEKADRVRSYIDELSDLERSRCSDLEECAAVFGRLMGEVFSYRDDMWKENLSRLGFYLGKYVYILDAYDDYEQDLKLGSFNPLITSKDCADSMDKVLPMLELSASKAAEYFELLPLIDDIEIMRNILYAGIWTRYEKVKEKRENGSI